MIVVIETSNGELSKNILQIIPLIRNSATSIQIIILFSYCRSFSMQKAQRYAELLRLFGFWFMRLNFAI